MALQTDGYNADTEGSNESPLLNESDEEMEEEKDPERAQIVLQKLDLNGGPPFLARDYMSADEFSDFSLESVEGSDSDYEDKPKKKRRAVRKIKCDECNRRFTSKTFMLKHKAVHSGAFACPKCDKKCSSAGSLRVHQRVHSGEKPYSCQECGKAFAFCLQLSAHTEREHGDRVLSFACDECDRAFYKESHLKLHQATHKARSHECHFCGRGFVSAAPLRAHVQRVHSAHRSARGDSPGDGGRRSGRAARVDYRPDVINVEAAPDEPPRKAKRRPTKAFAAAAVPSRLRQRDAPPAKGGRSRRPQYTGAGAQPSREPSRRTKAVVDYGDRSSSGVSDDEEAPRRRTARGRPARAAAAAAAAAEGDQDEEESETEAKAAKKPAKRGRQAGKRARPDEEEPESEEDEPRKTARGRGHQRNSAESEDDDEEQEEASTSARRGRNQQVRNSTAGASESEDGQDESARETPRGRGGATVARRSLAQRVQYQDEEDEDEERTTTPKRSSGSRGRDRRAASESDDSDADKPAAKKASPRRRASKPTAAANHSDDDEEEEEGEERAAENGASDDSGAEFSPSPKTPSRRGRAANAGSRPSATRSGGRRAVSTAHFADEASGASDSEPAKPAPRSARRGRAPRDSDDSDDDDDDDDGGEAAPRRATGRGRRPRDEAESRVPPKKRLRGRQ